MVWPKWLRTGEKAAAARRGVGPRAKAKTVASPAVELELQAHQLPAAWRSEGDLLEVTAPKRVAPGARVAVRVSGPGTVMAPLAGAVVSTEPLGVNSRAVVRLDEDQRGAVDRILGFLRSGRDAPRPRAPRYALTLPAFVISHDGNAYMTTFSVSRGGCGLTWTGEPPKIGSALELRLGSGRGSATFRGMVCWVRDFKRGRRVGVRFIAGQDAALVTLMKEASTS